MQGSKKAIPYSRRSDGTAEPFAPAQHSSPGKQEEKSVAYLVHTTGSISFLLQYGCMTTLRSTKRFPVLLGRAVLGGTAVAAAWIAGRRHEGRHSARLHRSLVEVLLNVLTAGDPLTARHSRRVANLTNVIAEALRLSHRERATLRVAALLHDMGKIDDRFFHIVHSRDGLTPEQRAQIEHHPHESAHILKPLERTHPGIMSVVASHHECWNGEGYPRGLRGSEIPLAARIITIADVFDALTQPRAYRDPFPPDKAFEELRGDSGTKFDPALIKLLDRPEVRRQWSQIARSGREAEAKAQHEDPEVPEAQRA
jgi:putative nucleotidyltransferase with HDIG domain